MKRYLLIVWNTDDDPEVRGPYAGEPERAIAAGEAYYDLSYSDAEVQGFYQLDVPEAVGPAQDERPRLYRLTRAELGEGV